MTDAKDCSCPGHGGAAVVHVVPCCDAMRLKAYWAARRKTKDKAA